MKEKGEEQDPTGRKTTAKRRGAGVCLQKNGIRPNGDPHRMSFLVIYEDKRRDMTKEIDKTGKVPL